MNLALPVDQFLTQPLVGPGTDSLTFMLYPGFKPGIFSAATVYPNHGTAGSTNEFTDFRLN